MRKSLSSHPQSMTDPGKMLVESIDTVSRYVQPPPHRSAWFARLARVAGPAREPLSAGRAGGARHARHAAPALRPPHAVSAPLAGGPGGAHGSGSSRHPRHRLAGHSGRGHGDSVARWSRGAGGAWWTRPSLHTRQTLGAGVARLSCWSLH